MAGQRPTLRPWTRTRRSVLASVGTVGLALAGGAARAAEGEAPQTAIIPAVEEFEDNYEGQFLSINEPAGEADADPVAVHEACEVPWPGDATTANVGQLSDRRRTSPVAVRLPVYMDDRQVDLVEDALFVVSSASACQGDYVQVELSWVTTRSLVGKPAGPTVAQDEEAGVQAADTPGESGDGFGSFAAVLGVAGALATWWRRSTGRRQDA